MARIEYSFYFSEHIFYLGHIACLPPSTGRLTPVLKLASSEARNEMALATLSNHLIRAIIKTDIYCTSPASPGLPRAWVVLECSRNFSYRSVSRPPLFWSSVTITPGLTELTLICLTASSRETHLVNWSRAALETL